MSKRWITAALLIPGLLLTNSCGDEFLGRTPKGQYSPATLQNASGVEGLLVGAYGALDGIPVQGSEWQGSMHAWVFGDIVSDDAYKGTDAGDQPEQTFLETYQWLTTNNHIRGKWGALYNGVARTNQVLQNLAKATDIPESRAAQITAEARFLRGFYHFEAKKLWNNIPYYDETTYNSTNPSSVKIANTEDAWPKIIADFEAAMDVLPETQPGFPGRPTKFAAMGMLAKSYMFQAFDVRTGAARMDNITKAKGYLDQIINSGKYSLNGVEYHDNWSADPANRNNKESVFEIQYSVTAAAPGGGNAGLDLAWPYNNGPGGCCGFYQPSQNLVNAHKTDENGLPLLDTFNNEDVKSDEGVNSKDPFTPYTGNLDPRLDWSVGRRGIPYLDWGTHPGRDWIRDQAYAGPYSPKKHIPEKRNSGVSSNIKRSGNNYRYLRYAHVLLWAAECEVELGNLGKAREYVNMVRNRAANPEGFVTIDGKPAANYVVKEYPAGAPQFASKEEARKAVRFEHRLEFAMEGTRFFDLVRWGIAAETLNAYVAKEQQRRTYLNGAQFIKGQHEYYPIPFQEIVNTKVNGQDVLQQNPGYN